jgi:hypothetical protein
VLQPVSVGLKFGFLIILYLFLLWVASSALFDLRRGFGRRGAAAPPAPPPDATGMHAAADPLMDLDGDFEPRLVVAKATGHEAGVAYDLSEGATLGRGDVEIQLDDPFASSQHARITRQARTLVIEDLGSTNGTYLNEDPLTGPQPLHDEDRIRIGDCEFVYRK